MYQRRLTWHTDEEITGTEVDLTMGVTEGLDHVLDVVGIVTGKHCLYSPFSAASNNL